MATQAGATSSNNNNNNEPNKHTYIYVLMHKINYNLIAYITQLFSLKVYIILS